MIMENKLSDPEICICAAVRMPDGYIVRGHRHADCLATAAKIPGYTVTGSHHPHGEDQGFVTSKNRYVNRREAMQLQLDANIDSVSRDGYCGWDLFSEDLY